MFIKLGLHILVVDIHRGLSDPRGGFVGFRPPRRMSPKVAKGIAIIQFGFKSLLPFALKTVACRIHRISLSVSVRRSYSSRVVGRIAIVKRPAFSNRQTSVLRALMAEATISGLLSIPFTQHLFVAPQPCHIKWVLKPHMAM